MEKNIFYAKFFFAEKNENFFSFLSENKLTFLLLRKDFLGFKTNQCIAFGIFFLHYFIYLLLFCIKRKQVTVEFFCDNKKIQISEHYINMVLCWRRK